MAGFPSVPDLVAGVRSGALSAAQVTAAALDRIRERNPELGAFLTVCEDEARWRAEEIDAAVSRGEDPGPLAGVPVAIKDNINTRGTLTTCGSRILEGFVPLHDATVVHRLRKAGAVVVGKTNLDEFGMGSSNENSAFGAVANPWDPQRVPGGSSGGSAAAVAAEMVPLALGSDTGGSVRQPAALCGVYGLKPTYGRVSRFGLVAYASSLDQIGGLAVDAAGLARLYEVVSGPDDRDSSSAPRPPDPVDPGAGVKGLRVGVAASLLGIGGVQPEVRAGVEWAASGLEQEGAAITPVELPDPEIAISAYYLLATAEASSNLARYDGVRYGIRIPADGLEGMYQATRSAGLGPEVKRRILLGTYVLSAGYYDAYYVKARKTRVLLARAFRQLFGEVDLILLPASPTTAFGLGEKTHDPLTMYLADVFTVYANLTGIPGISVPVARAGDGLPVGVQLLAAPWREDRLFLGAGALERLRGPLPRPPGAGGDE